MARIIENMVEAVIEDPVVDIFAEPADGASEGTLTLVGVTGLEADDVLFG